MSLLRNRRVRVDDLQRLVDDILATYAELGAVGEEQRQLMQGGATDPETREVFEAKRWRTVVTKAYDETAWYRQRFDSLGCPRTNSLRICISSGTPTETVTTPLRESPD